MIHFIGLFFDYILDTSRIEDCRILNSMDALMDSDQAKNCLDNEGCAAMNLTLVEATRLVQDRRC